MEIKNAKIYSAKLSTADYGQLIGALMFDYGGGVQGIGPFTLYNPKDKDREKVNLGGHFIYRCMEIVGVDDWSKMVGKPVRVLINNRRIDAIGHYLEDKWYYLVEEHEKLLGKRK